MAIVAPTIRRGMMRNILTFPVRRPIVFGVGFSCIKTSFADYLVQRYIEKREKIDWKRNTAFGLFGLFYLGGIQYILYVPIFKRLFPKAEEFAMKPLAEKLQDRSGQLTMLKQVFLDQCIHHPLLYFPCFYTMKEVVMGGTIADAKAKYTANCKEDIQALWKIWVPATIVNFTFMPMWARIPFVATTSLFWTCVLSMMRGGDHNPLIDEAQSDTWGNQGRALMGLAPNNAPALNPKMSHIVVTSCGDHKQAFLRLSRDLCEAGGNLVKSTAITVSGQLVVTMVVETPPQNIEKMNQKLQGFEGATISVSKLLVPKTDAERFECRLTCNGTDRPGVVAEVGNFLYEQNIRIEKFVQEKRLAVKADGKKYDGINIELVLSSDKMLDLDALQNSLNMFGEKRELTLLLRSPQQADEAAASD
mmetsp:Transcript_14406/g.25908  ORF Transcript_14406/g.25908 Transcript_14406/m.25908 type:complete len:418 (-) Transcript_14406:71-1324(-)